MQGMLSMPKIGPRRKRGAPLRAFTQAARASGNAGLDEEQQAIVAAWLSLSPAQQREVIEEVLSQQQDVVTMEDVVAVGGEGAQESEDPSQNEEPVVNADGGGAVIDGGDGLWHPGDPIIETNDGDD